MINIVLDVAAVFLMGNNAGTVLCLAVFFALYSVLLSYYAVREFINSNEQFPKNSFLSNSPFWQGAWVVFVWQVLFGVFNFITTRNLNNLRLGGILYIVFGALGGKLAYAKDGKKTQRSMKIWGIVLIIATIFLPVIIFGYRIYNAFGKDSVSLFNTVKTTVTSPSSDFNKTLFQQMYIQSCEKSGGSNAVCTCIGNCILSKYTITQMNDMGKQIRQTGKTPQDFIDASNLCKSNCSNSH